MLLQWFLLESRKCTIIIKRTKGTEWRVFQGSNKQQTKVEKNRQKEGEKKGEKAQDLCSSWERLIFLTLIMCPWWNTVSAWIDWDIKRGLAEWGGGVLLEGLSHKSNRRNLILSAPGHMTQKSASVSVIFGMTLVLLLTHKHVLPWWGWSSKELFEVFKQDHKQKEAGVKVEEK